MPSLPWHAGSRRRRSLAVGVLRLGNGRHLYRAVVPRPPGRRAPNDASGGWTPGSNGPGPGSISRVGPSSTVVASIAGQFWALPGRDIVAWRFTSPPEHLPGRGCRRPVLGIRRGRRRPEPGHRRVWGSDSGRLARLEGVGDSGRDGRLGTGFTIRGQLVDRACDGPAGYPDCQPAVARQRDHLELYDQRSPTTLPPKPEPRPAAQSPRPPGRARRLSASRRLTRAAASTRRFSRSTARRCWRGRSTIGAGGVSTRRPAAGVPLSTAVPDVGRRARSGGRQCAAGGRSRRCAAGLRRCRQPADRLCGAQDDRRSGENHRAGSSLAERGAANGDNAADAARLAARWARTQRATLTAPVRRSQRDPRAAHGRHRRRGAQRPHRAGHAIDIASGRAARQGRRADARRRALHADPAAQRVLADAAAALPQPRQRHRRRRREDARAQGPRGHQPVGLAARGHARPQRHGSAGGWSAGRCPQGGKVVELQARSPGEPWITFRTVRSIGGGRFATSLHLPARRAGASTRCGRASGRRTTIRSQPAFSRSCASACSEPPATVPRP